MQSMKRTYGGKKGEQVFYASRNAGKIDGVEEMRKGGKAKKKSKPFHGYNPNKHSRKGGLNAKGRAAAKRKSGANLKPPVTTKPSKLKPGGKKAKRRKSFCARMGGVKGPTSKGGKLTPKGAALKRWNC